MTFITTTPRQTQRLAAALAKRLPNGCYLAFRGGLGVGKTTFCHGLAQGLGCLDPVSSPTFSIVNYYRGPRPLAHFDMYRVQSREDLEAAGFFEYLEAGAVVAAEWSENVQALTGAADVTVTLEALADESRRITVEGLAGLEDLNGSQDPEDPRDAKDTEDSEAWVPEGSKTSRAPQVPQTLQVPGAAEGLETPQTPQKAGEDTP